MTNTPKPLTEAQFSEAEDAIDALVREATPGTPTRAAAEEVSADWEAAYGLPVATQVQREARQTAIAAVARKYRLVAD